jgi:hypothetical protein
VAAALVGKSLGRKKIFVRGMVVVLRVTPDCRNDTTRLAAISVYARCRSICICVWVACLFTSSKKMVEGMVEGTRSERVPYAF